MTGAPSRRPVVIEFEALTSPRALLGLCGLLAAAFALGTPIIGAWNATTYDHCASFISEFGARGMPHGALVGLGGFLPTGLFALGFCLLAARFHRNLPGFLLLSAVGLAYVAAALFPCEPGCPSSGGPVQRVHNVFGALEYVSGAGGLAVLSVRGPTLPRWSKVFAGMAAGLVMLSFTLMLLPDQAVHRGLWQRLADASLFGWMSGLALWHLRHALAGASTRERDERKDRLP